MHGGKAPQVLAKSARVIMEGLVGPALVEMERIITQPGVADSVKYSAIRDILDRTGFKPATQIEMVPSVEQVERWLSQIDNE